MSSGSDEEVINPLILWAVAFELVVLCLWRGLAGRFEPAFDLG